MMMSPIPTRAVAKSFRKTPPIWKYFKPFMKIEGKGGGKWWRMVASGPGSMSSCAKFIRPVKGRRNTRHTDPENILSEWSMSSSVMNAQKNGLKKKRRVVSAFADEEHHWRKKLTTTWTPHAPNSLTGFLRLNSLHLLHHI
jgi:hypothetical protein